MRKIKNKLIAVGQSSLILGIALGALAACDSNSSTAGGVGGNGSLAGGTKVTQIANKLTNKTADDELHTAGNFSIVKMGSGYDSVTNTATSGQSCLLNAYDPNNIYIGNPEAKINFEHTQDMEALEKALGVHVSGAFGGDRFGFSMSAKFANDSKDTSYTTNLLYLYQYAGKSTFKDLGENIDALRPGAAQTLREHPTDFRTMCGDQYVEQMDAGVVLAVRLALKFNSFSDKNRFDTDLNMNAGLANISSSIQYAAAKSGVHVELNISAMQQGGEPQKLNRIFGTPDSNGIYPIINCQTGNGDAGINACNLSISNIIAYGQTLEEQITKPDGSLYLDRLYYNNPTTYGYERLGIRLNGAPNPSAEILEAMTQLSYDYDKTMYDYQFVSHYNIALRGKLDTATTEVLRDAAEKLKSQINYVYLLPAYDVSDCYRGYVSSRCLIIRDNVQQGLKRYELTTVQKNMLDYLETNSYIGQLINYHGDAIAKPSDYKLSALRCVFAPVSSPTFGRYAINCDGKWLETLNPKGVNIKPGFLGSNLIISNLNYYSVAPNGTAGQWINYEDSLLSPDLSNPDAFSGVGIIVTAPQYSKDIDLEVAKSTKNLA